jgi:hypothetical protein
VNEGIVFALDLIEVDPISSFSIKEDLIFSFKISVDFIPVSIKVDLISSFVIDVDLILSIIIDVD